MTSHRLVTLTGEGGIGKTRLGLQVARQLLPEFADGVWVAELAPLADPALVPVAVATALGLELTGGAISPERVANMLGAKRLLLVLDNCEHVVAAATEIAETLLRCQLDNAGAGHQPRAAAGGGRMPLPGTAPRSAGAGDRGCRGRCCATVLCACSSRARRATDPHFRADGRSAADRGGNLPAARRHPAGDRVGGGPRRCARDSRDRRPAG